jgi:Spy/CpxP family protein refolding chaperone
MKETHPIFKTIFLIPHPAPPCGAGGIPLPERKTKQSETTAVKPWSFILAVLVLAAIFGPAFPEMLESEKPKIVVTREQKIESRIEKRLKELEAKLDLTLEQKIKIKEILNKSKVETAKILNEAAGKAKKVKEKADSEIEGVLTKEQREDLNEEGQEEEAPADEEDELLKVFK